MLFCLHWKNMKGLHACKWKCYDCVFLCLGLITCIYIPKRFLARPWWYLVQWTLKMNSKLDLILWLRKLQIKWATKLRYHVLFTTQHTGLHNQIVQDGISSLANNLKDRASDISQKKKQNFAGFSGANSRKNWPISREKSQNSRKNQLISRDFRRRKVKICRKIVRFHGILAEKSQISKDFKGQILRKIGRFHGKFRGETSPFFISPGY